MGLRPVAVTIPGWRLLREVLREMKEALVEIIDAQIHSWEGTPSGPWDDPPHMFDLKNPFTIEAAAAAMDAVGIAAAVISPPPSYRVRTEGGFYRYNSEYAQAAVRRHPGRFAYVAHYDNGDPDIADLIAGTRSHAGRLGTRVVVRSVEEWRAFHAGRYEALFSAAEEHRVPVMLFVSGHVSEAGPVARAHPGLQLIVDHLGLKQPPWMQRDPEPFQQLPRLLELARYPNVAVKLSGAPALSRERYPFPDLWPHLLRIVDAFGPERLMWGTDITRVRSLYNYSEAVGYLRYAKELSEADKALILGGTLRRLLRWPAADRGQR